MATTTLALSEKQEQMLLRLQRYLDVSNKCDVFRRGLQVLDLAREAESRGGELILRENGREIRLLLVK